MKTWSILSTLFVSALLYACSTSSGKNNVIENSEKIPVSIINLEQSATVIPIQTSGQFSTNDETMLSFKTGGVIDKIFVKEGDAVHKGQLLATLNLTEIKTQVTQAKLGFEKAQRDFERASRLYQDSVATLEQYQNAKTAADLAAQQYEAAKFNLSYSEIRAIDNGFVLRKLVNEGQVITSGSPVLQTNSGSEGNWILKVGLSDREWARITVGDKAEVTIETSNSKTYPAIVQRKSEGADPFTGTFGVELRLTGKMPEVIATGLFGKAVILPSKKQSSWAIPYESLLDGDGQTGFVFVTNDMKTAEQKHVVISGIEKDYVLISSGLENAKALITSGSAYLRDNSAIRVVEMP